jgi:hypothetical protein
MGPGRRLRRLRSTSVSRNNERKKNPRRLAKYILARNWQK